MSQEQQQHLRQRCVEMMVNIATNSGAFLSALEIIEEADELKTWIEFGAIEIPQPQVQAQA